MKVFISWSGASSNDAAEALSTLLKRVLPALAPWVSSKDIAVGLPWHRELTHQLKESRFAVLCLTRANLGAPWLNFEAGAVSNAFDESFVCPYLFDLHPEEIRDSPVGSFQACSADQEGTFKLIAALNHCLGDCALKERELKQRFDRAWVAFDEQLSSLRASARRTNEIFVAAPMTSLPNSRAYDVHRQEVMSAIAHLRGKFGKESVYSAVVRINKMAKAEPEKIGFQRDMKALQDAAKLVLFYPHAVASSSIFEAGCAFAMGKPAVYFVKKGASLPYVLEGAARNMPSLVSKLEYRDSNELLRIIDAQFDLLFPTRR
jgi:hypothetical protein